MGSFLESVGFGPVRSVEPERIRSLESLRKPSPREPSDNRDTGGKKEDTQQNPKVNKRKMKL